MKTRICSLIFFCVLIPCGVFAQTAHWSQEIIDKADTAKDAAFLTEQEKQIILLINLARSDGSLFARTYAEQFFNDNSINRRSGYVTSLIADLKKNKGMNVYNPSKNLSAAAAFHAKDMGITEKTGHNSSDGTDTFKRIKKFAKGGAMAENCSYGSSSNTAIGVVMQLLIDEGVPSLGHRKTILTGTYRAVGVSIQPHKRYGYNCVLDYSDTGD